MRGDGVMVVVFMIMMIRAAEIVLSYYPGYEHVE